VNIVTTGFVDGVEAQSESLGFDPAVVYVPHPIQNRTKAEIEKYRNTKDPIQVFQNQLVAEKVLTEALIEKIDAEARAEADLSADFAEASPSPTAADIQTDVYWEADNPAQRQSQGRLFFD